MSVNLVANIRAFLLVMSVLAFLTVTVLDGVVVRYMMKPFVRKMEELSEGRAQYPPGYLFMLENAWARRLYNLVFAWITFAAWWYLGTPAGLAMLQRGRSRAALIARESCSLARARRLYQLMPAVVMLRRLAA